MVHLAHILGDGVGGRRRKEETCLKAQPATQQDEKAHQGPCKDDLDLKLLQAVSGRNLQYNAGKQWHSTPGQRGGRKHKQQWQEAGQHRCYFVDTLVLLLLLFFLSWVCVVVCVPCSLCVCIPPPRYVVLALSSFPPSTTLSTLFNCCSNCLYVICLVRVYCMSLCCVSVVCLAVIHLP